MIGYPDVYPKHGDVIGAWAVDIDNYQGQQYIEVILLAGSHFI